jgi:regulator of cell morphogenesis and NO signaling
MSTPAKVFTAHQPMGDIVSEFPEAGRILLRYRIDYCCRSKEPLAIIRHDNGNQSAAIIDEINRKFSSSIAIGLRSANWKSMSSSEAIGMIIRGYHIPIRNSLESVHQLLERITETHNFPQTEFTEMSKLYKFLHKELMRHFTLEENVLFPCLLAQEAGRASAAWQICSQSELIQSMEAEHKDYVGILFKLLEISDRFTKSSILHEDISSLSAKLEVLAENLMQLFFIENHYLLFKCSSS